MATRALQQSATVKLVQGKYILRRSFCRLAAPVQEKKKKKKKPAAAECFWPSFDPMIRNGCLFSLLATTAAYGLSIGCHVTLLGQWETPVAQSCAYIPSECSSSSSDHPFDALRRRLGTRSAQKHTLAGTFPRPPFPATSSSQIAPYQPRF